MSQESQEPTEPGSRPAKPPKEQWLRARIDTALIRQAREKAHQRGWKLGAVIRVLLRRWLQEDSLTNEEMAEEQKRAPKVPRSRPAGKKRRH